MFICILLIRSSWWSLLGLFGRGWCGRIFQLTTGHAFKGINLPIFLAIGVLIMMSCLFLVCFADFLAFGWWILVEHHLLMSNYKFLSCSHMSASWVGLNHFEVVLNSKKAILGGLLRLGVFVALSSSWKSLSIWRCLLAIQIGRDYDAWPWLAGYNWLFVMHLSAFKPFGFLVYFGGLWKILEELGWICWLRCELGFDDGLACFLGHFSLGWDFGLTWKAIEWGGVVWVCEVGFH